MSSQTSHMCLSCSCLSPHHLPISISQSYSSSRTGQKNPYSSLTSLSFTSVHRKTLTPLPSKHSQSSLSQGLPPLQYPGPRHHPLSQITAVTSYLPRQPLNLFATQQPGKACQNKVRSCLSSTRNCREKGRVFSGVSRAGTSRLPTPTTTSSHHGLLSLAQFQPHPPLSFRSSCSAWKTLGQMSVQLPLYQAE